jgi:hypothetical protein
MLKYELAGRNAGQGERASERVHGKICVKRSAETKKTMEKGGKKRDEQRKSHRKADEGS